MVARRWRVSQSSSVALTRENGISAVVTDVWYRTSCRDGRCRSRVVKMADVDNSWRAGSPTTCDVAATPTAAAAAVTSEARQTNVVDKEDVNPRIDAAVEAGQQHRDRHDVACSSAQSTQLATTHPVVTLFQQRAVMFHEHSPAASEGNTGTSFKTTTTQCAPSHKHTWRSYCREPVCTKSICPLKLYKKSSQSPFALRLSVCSRRSILCN